MAWWFYVTSPLQCILWFLRLFTPKKPEEPRNRPRRNIPKTEKVNKPRIQLTRNLYTDHKSDDNRSENTKIFSDSKSKTIKISALSASSAVIKSSSSSSLRLESSQITEAELNLSKTDDQLSNYKCRLVNEKEIHGISQPGATVYCTTMSHEDCIYSKYENPSFEKTELSSGMLKGQIATEEQTKKKFSITGGSHKDVKSNIYEAEENLDPIQSEYPENLFIELPDNFLSEQPPEDFWVKQHDNSLSQQPSENFSMKQPDTTLSTQPLENYFIELPDNFLSKQPPENFFIELPNNFLSKQPPENFFIELPDNSPSTHLPENFSIKLHDSSFSNESSEKFTIELPNHFLSQEPQKLRGNIFKQKENFLETTDSDMFTASSCKSFNKERPNDDVENKRTKVSTDNGNEFDIVSNNKEVVYSLTDRKGKFEDLKAFNRITHKNVVTSSSDEYNCMKTEEILIGENKTAVEEELNQLYIKEKGPEISISAQEKRQMQNYSTEINDFAVKNGMSELSSALDPNHITFSPPNQAYEQELLKTSNLTSVLSISETNTFPIAKQFFESEKLDISVYDEESDDSESSDSTCKYSNSENDVLELDLADSLAIVTTSQLVNSELDVKNLRTSETLKDLEFLVTAKKTYKKIPYESCSVDETISTSSASKFSNPQKDRELQESDYLTASEFIHERTMPSNKTAVRESRAFSEGDSIAETTIINNETYVYKPDRLVQIIESFVKDPDSSEIAPKNTTATQENNSTDLEHTNMKSNSSQYFSLPATNEIRVLSPLEELEFEDKQFSTTPDEIPIYKKEKLDNETVNWAFKNSSSESFTKENQEGKHPDSVNSPYDIYNFEKVIPEHESGLTSTCSRNHSRTLDGKFENLEHDDLELNNPTKESNICEKGKQDHEPVSLASNPPKSESVTFESVIENQEVEHSHLINSSYDINNFEKVIPEHASGHTSTCSRNQSLTLDSEIKNLEHDDYELSNPTEENPICEKEKQDHEPVILASNPPRSESVTFESVIENQEVEHSDLINSSHDINNFEQVIPEYASGHTSSCSRNQSPTLEKEIKRLEHDDFRLTNPIEERPICEKEIQDHEPVILVTNPPKFESVTFESVIENQEVEHANLINSSHDINNFEKVIPEHASGYTSTGSRNQSLTLDGEIKNLEHDDYELSNPTEENPICVKEKQDHELVILASNPPRSESVPFKSVIENQELKHSDLFNSSHDINNFEQVIPEHASGHTSTCSRNQSPTLDGKFENLKQDDYELSNPTEENPIYEKEKPGHDLFNLVSNTLSYESVPFESVIENQEVEHLDLVNSPQDVHNFEKVIPEHATDHTSTCPRNQSPILEGEIKNLKHDDYELSNTTEESHNCEKEKPAHEPVSLASNPPKSESVTFESVIKNQEVDYAHLINSSHDINNFEKVIPEHTSGHTSTCSRNQSPTLENAMKHLEHDDFELTNPIEENTIYEKEKLGHKPFYLISNTLSSESVPFESVIENQEVEHLDLVNSPQDDHNFEKMIPEHASDHTSNCSRNQSPTLDGEIKNLEHDDYELSNPTEENPICEKEKQDHEPVSLASNPPRSESVTFKSVIENQEVEHSDLFNSSHDINNFEQAILEHASGHTSTCSRNQSPTLDGKFENLKYDGYELSNPTKESHICEKEKLDHGPASLAPNPPKSESVTFESVIENQEVEHAHLINSAHAINNFEKVIPAQISGHSSTCSRNQSLTLEGKIKNIEHDDYGVSNPTEETHIYEIEKLDHEPASSASNPPRSESVTFESVIENQEVEHLDLINSFHDINDFENVIPEHASGHTLTCSRNQSLTLENEIKNLEYDDFELTNPTEKNTIYEKEKLDHEPFSLTSNTLSSESVTFESVIENQEVEHMDLFNSSHDNNNFEKRIPEHHIDCTLPYSRNESTTLKREEINLELNDEQLDNTTDEISNYEKESSYQSQTKEIGVRDHDYEDTFPNYGGTYGVLNFGKNIQEQDFYDFSSNGSQCGSPISDFELKSEEVESLVSSNSAYGIINFEKEMQEQELDELSSSDSKCESTASDFIMIDQDLENLTYGILNFGKEIQEQHPDDFASNESKFDSLTSEFRIKEQEDESLWSLSNATRANSTQEKNKNEQMENVLLTNNSVDKLLTNENGAKKITMVLDKESNDSSADHQNAELKSEENSIKTLEANYLPFEISDVLEGETHQVITELPSLENVKEQKLNDLTTEDSKLEFSIDEPINTKSHNDVLIYEKEIKENEQTKCDQNELTSYKKEEQEDDLNELLFRDSKFAEDTSSERKGFDEALGSSDYIDVKLDQGSDVIDELKNDNEHQLLTQESILQKYKLGNFISMDPKKQCLSADKEIDLDSPSKNFSPSPTQNFETESFEEEFYVINLKESSLKSQHIFSETKDRIIQEPQKEIVNYEKDVDKTFLKFESDRKDIDGFSTNNAEIIGNLEVEEKEQGFSSTKSICGNLSFGDIVTEPELNDLVPNDLKEAVEGFQALDAESEPKDQHLENIRTSDAPWAASNFQGTGNNENKESEEIEDKEKQLSDDFMCNIDLVCKSSLLEKQKEWNNYFRDDSKRKDTSPNDLLDTQALEEIKNSKNLDLQDSNKLEFKEANYEMKELANRKEQISKSTANESLNQLQEEKTIDDAGQTKSKESTEFSVSESKKDTAIAYLGCNNEAKELENSEDSLVSLPPALATETKEPISSSLLTSYINSESLGFSNKKLEGDYVNDFEVTDSGPKFTVDQRTLFKPEPEESIPAEPTSSNDSRIITDYPDSIERKVINNSDPNKTRTQGEEIDDCTKGGVSDLTTEISSNSSVKEPCSQMESFLEEADTPVIRRIKSTTDASRYRVDSMNKRRGMRSLQNFKESFEGTNTASIDDQLNIKKTLKLSEEAEVLASSSAKIEKRLGNVIFPIELINEASDQFSRLQDSEEPIVKTSSIKIETKSNRQAILLPLDDETSKGFDTETNAAKEKDFVISIHVQGLTNKLIEEESLSASQEQLCNKEILLTTVKKIDDEFSANEGNENRFRSKSLDENEGEGANEQLSFRYSKKPLRGVALSEMRQTFNEGMEINENINLSIYNELFPKKQIECEGSQLNPLRHEENVKDSLQEYNKMSKKPIGGVPLFGLRRKEESKDPKGSVPLFTVGHGDEIKKPIGGAPLIDVRQKEVGGVLLSGVGHKEEIKNHIGGVTLFGAVQTENNKQPIGVVPLLGVKHKEESRNHKGGVALFGLRQTHVHQSIEDEFVQQKNEKKLASSALLVKDDHKSDCSVSQFEIDQRIHNDDVFLSKGKKPVGGVSLFGGVPIFGKDNLSFGETPMLKKVEKTYECQNSPVIEKYKPVGGVPLFNLGEKRKPIGGVKLFGGIELAEKLKGRRERLSEPSDDDLPPSPGVGEKRVNEIPAAAPALLKRPFDVLQLNAGQNRKPAGGVQLFGGGEFFEKLKVRRGKLSEDNEDDFPEPEKRKFVAENRYPDDSVTNFSSDINKGVENFFQRYNIANDDANHIADDNDDIVMAIDGLDKGKITLQHITKSRPKGPHNRRPRQMHPKTDGKIR